MKKTVNEHGEQIISMTLEERGPLTNEEIIMLQDARKREPVFDEDCPPMSESMHRQVQSQIAAKRRMRQASGS